MLPDRVSNPGPSNIMQKDCTTRPILAKKMPYLRLQLEKMHGIRCSSAYFFKDIIIFYNLYAFPENGDITSM